MVCYKGGLAIQQNHQMCDVTSRSGNSLRVAYGQPGVDRSWI